jgi:hypothetical protein
MPKRTSAPTSSGRVWYMAACSGPRLQAACR